MLPHFAIVKQQTLSNDSASCMKNSLRPKLRRRIRTFFKVKYAICTTKELYAYLLAQRVDGCWSGGCHCEMEKSVNKIKEGEEGMMIKKG